MLSTYRKKILITSAVRFFAAGLKLRENLQVTPVFRTTLQLPPDMRCRESILATLSAFKDP